MEHKVLGADPRNSASRSTVLMNISRIWTAVAHQLESLAVILEIGRRVKSASFGEWAVAPSDLAVRFASVALIDKFDAAGISVPPHHTTMLCRFEAI